MPFSRPKRSSAAGPDATGVAGLLIAVLLALLSLPAVAAAGAEGDPESWLDPSPESRRGRSALLSGGLDFPVVGSQGVQPHLAGYLDLPRALQIGLKARVDPVKARTGYDYIPQIGLQLRQLWLSDQDSSTVRNSEYFTVIIGGYYAYDFLGNRAGPRPFLALALGKHWMPFNNQPFGLDFSLEMERYFDGVPQRKPRTIFLTAGVSLFRAFPLR